MARVTLKKRTTNNVALVQPISSGEQTVTATGAITGSLSTNGLPRTGWLKVRIRGLQPGQYMRIDIEDTANVTPFSDALQVWSVEATAGQEAANQPSATLPYETDAVYGIELFRLPDMRFGSTNNALRGNTQAITASTTALVTIWLEQ